MKRESGVEFTVNCGSEVPQDDERKGGSSSGISEADQLSECDDDSSDDNDSVLEEDGTEPQLLNKELGFFYTAPRTRSGRPFYFPRNVINTSLYHPLHFKICKIVP